MLLHVQLDGWGFTTIHSLLAIIGILGVSIAASLIWPEKSRKAAKVITELTGEKPV